MYNLHTMTLKCLRHTDGTNFITWTAHLDLLCKFLISDLTMYTTLTAELLFVENTKDRNNLISSYRESMVWDIIQNSYWCITVIPYLTVLTGHL